MNALPPDLRQQLIDAAALRRVLRYTARCGCGAVIDLNARTCERCGGSGDLAVPVRPSTLPPAGRRRPEQFRAVVALGGLS